MWTIGWKLITLFRSFDPIFYIQELTFIYFLILFVEDFVLHFIWRDFVFQLNFVVVDVLKQESGSFLKRVCLFDQADHCHNYTALLL